MRFNYTAYWKDKPHPTSTIDIEGFAADDHILADIRRRGTFYEVDLLEHIATRGPRGGVFVDVGANIGNHSVFFGKFLAEHLVAIEAAPSLAPILKRNLEANDIRNYSLVTCGVGADAGVGRIILPNSDERNIGKSRLHVQPGLDGRSPESGAVPIRTLDEILGEIRQDFRGKPIAFMKVDVEGMELEVLRGAIQLLRDERPQLAIEAATPAELSEIKTFLEQYSYEDVGRFCHTPTHYFINPSVHHLRPSQPLAKPDTEREALQQAMEEIAARIAPGESLILVDENQWAGRASDPSRNYIPFLEKEGNYWGWPADDEIAIRECERLRKQGAKFIVFAWPGFWWLEHYAGFAQHLRSRHRCILSNERLIIFQFND